MGLISSLLLALQAQPGPSVLAGEQAPGDGRARRSRAGRSLGSSLEGREFLRGFLAAAAGPGCSSGRKLLACDDMAGWF